MVAMFAVELALKASNNTPVGDASMYPALYERRSQLYDGLPPEEGYHRGSWQYSESQELDFIPVIYDQSSMLNDVQYSAESQYKLGDNFNIGSTGPAIEKLEDNYSYQTYNRGIVKPTTEQIQAAFAVDSQTNYNNG